MSVEEQDELVMALILQRDQSIVIRVRRILEEVLPRLHFPDLMHGIAKRHFFDETDAIAVDPKVWDEDVFQEILHEEMYLYGYEMYSLHRLHSGETLYDFAMIKEEDYEEDELTTSTMSGEE